MSTSRVWALAAIAAFSIFQLGSQSLKPAISITSIPAWGQDGGIAISVSGTGYQPLAVYVFAYIPDVGWQGLPGGCSPIVTQDGILNINAASTLIQRYATRFSVYLEPVGLNVVCSDAATVPFVVQRNAVASATIPRIPQYTTVTFGGLEWYVKDAPVKVSPGPQFFIKENVYVDALGYLHLRVTRCGDSWCAAEVFTKQAVGYGTYRFAVNSQLSSLDPNLTLGLFSWDGQAGDLYNREWDIEFSRWGSPSAPANAQYVVQPYNLANNMHRFLIGPSTPSLHTVMWLPNMVGFTTSSASGAPLNQWTFTPGQTPVPTPGDVHLHLNFYIGAGQTPFVQSNQEIVISSLEYTASNPQIGFSRAADTLPFQAGSYNVPIASTGTTCSATVESDSPWLSVVGSNPVPSGIPVQYAVTDNFGGERKGNLILRTTSCVPALGAQVLSVSQAGFTCSPAFESPSTHFGYWQSVLPVGIKAGVSLCTWTVNSSSPWLHIVSGNSGAGDGTVQVLAEANQDAALRGAVLTLNTGSAHSLYQDGAAMMLALSPGRACGGQTGQFGLSWSAPGDVEFRLNSMTGQSAGIFGPTGTTLLSGIPDGAMIFMIPANSGGGLPALASARASVVSNCTGPAIAPLGIVNAASYDAHSLAPNSLASVFGANLSNTTAQATGSTYPTTLAGASVWLGGQACPLWYASSGQINFAVPGNLVPGRYPLTVGTAISDVLITNVSPGIFTVKGNGTGVPLATVTAVLVDGTKVPLEPYRCSGAGCSIVPISLPSDLTDLYIVLYGTGIRNYKSISATLGPINAEVQYAGPQGQFPGLDQVNIHAAKPFSSLSGTQTLRLRVDGTNSNGVTFLFAD